MTLDDLAQTLIQFTNENYATQELQRFFKLVRQLAMNGMGIGIGDKLPTSGEAVMMKFVRGALRRDYPDSPLTIFDVGANVGQFIAVALSAFGEGDYYFYSFEPSPEAFAELQKAVKGFPQVRPFCLGFGDCDQTVPLYGDKAGSTLASLYKRQLDYCGIQMHQIGEAAITTIDRFAEEHAIERIHFLKLDVEGHELNCINGARKLIDAGRIDYLQFEFGGANIDSHTYFRDFWYALPNYHIKRVLRDGFYDIDAYSETEESSLTQNFLACRKK